MRFLFDEGLPFRLVSALRAEGHDVTVCGRDYPQALSDSDILAIAFAEQRILLTNDKDFGELVFRDRRPHAGIVLFRAGYMTIDARIALLRQVLADHSDQMNQFIVVSSRGSRIASA